MTHANAMKSVDFIISNPFGMSSFSPEKAVFIASDSRTFWTESEGLNSTEEYGLDEEVLLITRASALGYVAAASLLIIVGSAFCFWSAYLEDWTLRIKSEKGRIGSGQHL
jgi:hypothetical protein